MSGRSEKLYPECVTRNGKPGPSLVTEAEVRASHVPWRLDRNAALRDRLLALPLWAAGAGLGRGTIRAVPMLR